MLRLLADPLALALALPWCAVVAWLWRRNDVALRWLRAHLSARFLPVWTRYSDRRLRRHMIVLGLLGLTLVLAASGPFRLADGERVEARRVVVLLLDASLSMGAPDAGRAPASADDEERQRRFELARAFAWQLIEAQPETAFAVLSFSGQTVLHTPPTTDRFALETLIKTLQRHYDLEHAGSDTAGSFETTAATMARAEDAFDVVLLSDGDMPEAEGEREALQVLAERGARVHTVAFGSAAGLNMNLYEPADVIANLEEKRVLLEYHTRRDEQRLRRLAERTEGVALVVEEGDWVDELLPTLRTAPSRPVRVEERTAADLSWLLLALFGIGYVLERLVYAPPSPAARRQALAELPWARAAGTRAPGSGTVRELPGRRVAGTRAPGSGTVRELPGRRVAGTRPAGGGAGGAAAAVVLLAPLLLSGCGLAPVRADRLNRAGLGRLAAGEPDEASARFAASAEAGFRAHVPLYNQATSDYRAARYEDAHQGFQRAIRLSPRFAEAYYNDGHTLFAWGRQELDLCGCELRRARAFLVQAQGRFGRVLELRRLGRLRRDAEYDLHAVTQALQDLDRQQERCDAGGGGGGGGGEGGGEGEGGGGEQPPPSQRPPPEGEGEGQAEPPPPEGEGEGQGDPPPSGGGSGESQGQPPPLSGEELGQLERERERIRGESAAASSFEHSAASRLKGPGGRPIEH